MRNALPFSNAAPNPTWLGLPPLLSPLLLLLLLSLSACLGAPQPAGAGQPATTAPRILVSNDDGIDSPGLLALVKELATLGEVVVVAPDGNRSGASHSVTSLGKELSVVQREIEGASLAQAVSGTPADAVNFALVMHGKEKPFDVVVSGINRGANVGLVAHYSGTVGAAMEAVYQGIPGIAVSADRRQQDHGIAARLVADFVRVLLKNGAPRGIGYSINVPPGPLAELEGVAVSRMGGSFIQIPAYERTSQAIDSAAATYKARAQYLDSGPEGTDTAAYYNGYVTITPIRLDWTDAPTLEQLRGWKLALRQP